MNVLPNSDVVRTKVEGFDLEAGARLEGPVRDLDR
jgi:hypothetical protein